jgi:hypothetical protein
MRHASCAQHKRRPGANQRPAFTAGAQTASHDTRPRAPPLSTPLSTFLRLTRARSVRPGLARPCDIVVQRRPAHEGTRIRHATGEMPCLVKRRDRTSRPRSRRHTPRTRHQVASRTRPAEDYQAAVDESLDMTFPASDPISGRGRACRAPDADAARRRRLDAQEGQRAPACWRKGCRAHWHHWRQRHRRKAGNKGGDKRH